MSQITLQRTFIVGEEWLYYKIYTGTKTADIILSQAIFPIVLKLQEENIIDQWFFIRYTDPKFHLRIRFHLKNSENTSTIIQMMKDALVDWVRQDLVWKIQLDTYQRELERYGQYSTQLMEEIFFADSQMVCQLIDNIEGEEGENIRWLFGFRSIDNFLDSFHLTLPEKIELIERLKISFRAEFDNKNLMKGQLSDKYRKLRTQIEGFQTMTRESDPDYEILLDILDEKTQRITPICEEILALLQNNLLEIPLNSLLGSLLHMQINRLFKSNNRLHEMVLYDLLYQFYRSMAGRVKNKQAH